MKKLLSVLLTICLVFGCISASFAKDFDGSLWTDTYLVVDLTTKDVLAASNADVRMYPASLTKMMTAILAYEYFIGEPYGLSTMVYADYEACEVEPTKFYLKEGEEMSVEEAINIMLIMSANDIAIMLAKAVGGTTEYFAGMMNEKAREIGCTDTNFVTPNGLHDDNHYSTARDLALIAEYLLDNEFLASVVAKPYYDYDATNRHGSGRIYSTNLLFESDSRIYVGSHITEAKYTGGRVFGVKTGTTPEAGGCLITAVEKDGTKILSVILNSRYYDSYQIERFADAHMLFDWAFANYRTVKAASLGDEGDIVKVKKGEFNKVETMLSEDIYLTLPVEKPDSVITKSYEYDEYITAPFEEGTKVGTMHLFESGVEIGSYDMITRTGVVKGGILSNFGIEDSQAKVIFRTAGNILLVILSLVLLLLLVRAYNKRRYAKKRAEKARRKAERLAREKELQEKIERGEIERPVTYYFDKKE